MTITTIRAPTEIAKEQLLYLNKDLPQIASHGMPASNGSLAVDSLFIAHAAL